MRGDDLADLSLQEITFQQGIWINQVDPEAVNYLFGIKALAIETTNIGGILTWNIFRMRCFSLPS